MSIGCINLLSLTSLYIYIYSVLYSTYLYLHCKKIYASYNILNCPIPISFLLETSNTFLNLFMFISGYWILRQMRNIKTIVLIKNLNIAYFGLIDELRIFLFKYTNLEIHWTISIEPLSWSEVRSFALQNT